MLTLAAFVAVSLALCAPARLAATESVRVAVTLDMIGQWVKAVGGDDVELVVLSPIGSDPHTFEPTARAINSARTAQAVFAIGLGLEPWLERIKHNDDALKIVPLASVGGLLAIAGGHHDHTHSHDEKQKPPPLSSDHSDQHDGEPDPHVWMDPLLVKQMVAVIAETLSALQPQKAETFAKNAQNYQAQLDVLNSEIEKTLAPIPQARRKLVTNHDNLRYFAKRYDFEIVDTLFGIQGLESGQPSARKVRELVRQLERQGIRAVFADAFSNSNLLVTVTKESGIAQPVVLYPMVGPAGSPASDYMSMMRFNAEQIAKALDDAH